MKRALLIGLNYQGTSSQLNGCINDITNVKKLLIDRGFSSFLELKDDGSTVYPTKSVIMDHIKMFANSAKAGDTLAMFYSGHGGQSGFSSIESDGINECIYSPRLEVISDDEITGALFSSLPECKVFCMFDSCHSGSVVDLPFHYVIPESRMIKPEKLPFIGSFFGTKYKDIIPSKPWEVLPEGSVVQTKADVILLSGCKTTQTSADDWFQVKQMQGEGALTHFFLEALGKSLKYYDILKYINVQLKQYGYQQTPQLYAYKNDYDLMTDIWL